MDTFKNEFSWSFSRKVLFEECQRKYYYHYYGSWGGWEKDKADNITRILYVLKHLQSRHQWKGSIVHNEIARIIKQFVSTGKLTPIEVSLLRIKNLMIRDFRYSKSSLYWEAYGSLRERVALFEHEYEIDIPDEEWKKTYKEIKECIKNFYKSSILEKIIHLDSESILSIDSITPTQFCFNREKIYINLDLAYKIEDRIEIVDWKTGIGESDQRQFLLYTLYAREVLGIPLNKISVVEFNLLNQHQKIHKFGLEDIKIAKRNINNSISIMKGQLIDSVENVAVITDFPRTNDITKCISCNFRKICFDLP